MILEMLQDTKLWALGIPLLIMIYNFILFLWWWRRIGSATEVYIYITFLFGTGALVLGFGFYADCLPYCCGEGYQESWMQTWIWGVRTIPLFIVTVLIALRMTQRILRTRYYKKYSEKDRRETIQQTTKW